MTRRLACSRTTGPMPWVGSDSGPEPAFRASCARGNLKAVDDLPAWSVVCFYIARLRRGEGIARALLDGAATYAQEHGAPAIEGYARDVGDTRLSADAAYPGTVSLFAGAGSTRSRGICHRAERTHRVTMRRDLDRNLRTAPTVRPSAMTQRPTAERLFPTLVACVLLAACTATAAVPPTDPAVPLSSPASTPALVLPAPSLAAASSPTLPTTGGVRSPPSPSIPTPGCRRRPPSIGSCAR